VAFGVGTTDIANAFMTGAVRFAMPEVLRIEVDGRLPVGVSAKDLVLHLLALPAIRAGAGVGRVFEFGGTAVRALGIDERATLTNMTAELGGFTGMVEPDEETVRFLRERRGLEFEIEPWMRSDADARYAQRISIDAGTLSPMVARPGDPGLGLPLSALGTRPRIHIAYGGSCTAGKREDFEQYHAVLAWAAQRGLCVAPSVTLYLQFGTEDVPRLLRAPGLDRDLRSGGRAAAAAGLRRLRQLRPWRVHGRRTGDGERHQPQLPRPLRPRPGVAGQPGHGGGECHRRRAAVLRRAAAARVASADPRPCACDRAMRSDRGRSHRPAAGESR
jgi:homoaconitase/3-isopropylmalate dehydratase large subunit